MSSHEVVRHLHPVHYEGGCGGRLGFEEDYSIHLEGKVSVVEWVESIHALNAVVARYGMRRALGMTLTFVCILPLFFYIPMFTVWGGDDGTYFIFWWIIPALVEVVLMIVLLVVIAMRRRKLWRELNRVLGDINARFQGRGVNFCCRRPLHDHYYGYNRGFYRSRVVLVVEVRGDHGYQQPMVYGAGFQAGNLNQPPTYPVAGNPVAPPPQYFAQPPNMYQAPNPGNTSLPSMLQGDKRPPGEDTQPLLYK
mmetsp:Transcript_138268/g.195708  ORF Transcript_138268/g.195708 Transcript_138268/m.195708 type:complete len:251 (+) Transcript_138268:70-822(+)